MLVFYRGVGNGGPGSFCDRSSWRWVQLDGPCWNSLVNLSDGYGWVDIILLTGYCGISACAITVLIRKYAKCAPNLFVEGFVYRLVVALTIFMLIFVIGLACFRRPSISRDEVNIISSQLLDSLDLMDGNVTRAWQNTIRDGCCCGVFGRQDFVDRMMDVSPYCRCDAHEWEAPICYPGCYASSSQSCTADANTTYSKFGCLEYVMEKIQDSKDVMATIQYMSVFITTALILRFSAWELCVCCCMNILPRSFLGGDASKNHTHFKSVYKFLTSRIKCVVSILNTAI